LEYNKNTNNTHKAASGNNCNSTIGKTNANKYVHLDLKEINLD